MGLKEDIQHNKQIAEKIKKEYENLSSNEERQEKFNFFTEQIKANFPKCDKNSQKNLQEILNFINSEYRNLLNENIEIRNKAIYNLNTAIEIYDTMENDILTTLKDKFGISFK